MQKKAAFYTLGCKVNQYETEAMEELFENAGYTVVDFDDVADVYIINTCTVTARSDSKSRNLIHKALKLNPNAVIGVVGCYAQVAPEEIMDIPGVDLVVGTNHKQEIVHLVEEAMKGKKINAVENIWQQKDFEQLTVKGHKGRTRAYVKIQEGCNQFCTYCIIPYARGPVRSRPVEHAMEEIRRLAAAGFKEIVLTGIHIASYGKDLKGESLIDLIEAVNEVEGLKRIRMSSVEPSLLTDEFVSRVSRMPKFCRHFHISLQSGCDETLRRMHRKYTTSEYRSIVERVRRYIPDVAITTDIMVGFPGETEEEFEKSYEFVKEIGFSHIHVFKYSRRKGTPAAEYPDQVKNSVKEQRSKKMIQLGNILKQNYMSRFLGTTQEVLFEQPVNDRPGYIEGLTDTYIRVLVKGDESLNNRLIPVEFTAIEDDHIIGKIN
ncbi:threonylcarbamoyladenosine tRNA methylthiotransferase MtaB [Caldanaerobius fijiensis DSM 17918]|uniref:Threonylcarbamoyladenosine tRNA methylthiotransferase MtaB n=1 Tax=Caldanaerobius fijiensis DSM 17918 TaxID=1121256 RepID=A0A1M4SEF5_9THEO|nr:tRNA (N(6)-L-threonylcarbamoyladenosine(37)-C(2))-methylthiotransferase MtaB [Caldanaerobius fijiensis]SHE30634.1 threonylcarbamoyladenosine tRNA methylthiotransferase MtaB [Caldanaerobius fijiensis DSM 17918]